MQTNPALYANYQNGKFANSIWADKDGNAITFSTGTAKLNGNIWGEYTNIELISKDTGNDSITVFNNNEACFRFTLSYTLSKPALLLSNHDMIAFYETTQNA